MGDGVECGIAVKSFLICGMVNSKSLRVFDNDLNQVKQLKL